MSELEIYKGMVKKMKDDEIKEKLKLIDGFFNKSWACDLDEVYHAVIDTITNLQQELEKRNAYIKYLEEYNPKYYKGEKFYGDGREDYKSRCEKAVEYLKKPRGNYYRDLNYEPIKVITLINILNGRSDE